MQLCTGIRVQTDVHEAPRVCENRTGYQDQAGQRNCTAGRVVFREWQSADTYSSHPVDTSALNKGLYN